MATKQGELTLLQDSVAQELLQSRLPARLAYNWLDNSPRVVPIWFHWTGEEIVLGTPTKAPRLKAEILSHSQISVTMNTYSHLLPEM